MAASCWRRRNSRWFFSRPSLTSARIFSWRLSCASASFTQPRSLATRSATSRVSNSSTLRAMVSSGHHPAASARASGSSRPRITSTRRGVPNASTRAWNAARSSAASSWARGVISGWTGSASTQVTASGSSASSEVGSDRPVRLVTAPRRARWVARTTRAGVPDGRAPRDSTVTTAPTVAERPSTRGTRRSRPSCPAASTAARASEVSRAMVRTMPGKTTPLVSGRIGRVRVVVSVTVRSRGRGDGAPTNATDEVDIPALRFPELGDPGQAARVRRCRRPRLRPAPRPGCSRPGWRT